MDIAASPAELAGLAAATVASGAVSGLLAGIFGIGGGAVIVPVLYQGLSFLGVDEAVRMHLSVGTSLAVIVPTSIRSFLAHYRRGAVDMDLLRGWVLADTGRRRRRLDHRGVDLRGGAARHLRGHRLHRRPASAAQSRVMAARQRDPGQSGPRRRWRAHRFPVDADGDRRRRPQQHLHDALRTADPSGRRHLGRRRRADLDPGRRSATSGRAGTMRRCRRFPPASSIWSACCWSSRSR